jgi:hypothetical protein
MILHTRNKYHQLLAICLLILVSFQSMGYWTFVAVSREFAREEMMMKMKKEIPQKFLVSIKHNSSLIWEHSSEFEWNGVMYDVVKTITTKSGEVIYQCINDEKENDIIQHLEKTIKKNCDEKKSSQKSTTKYCCIDDLKAEKNKTLYFKNKNIFIYNNTYQNTFSISINQPPKLS